MILHATVSKSIRAGILAGVTVMSLGAPAAHAIVVYKNLAATPLTVPNNIDGVYLNVVTGVTGASATAVTGYDINIYNNNAGLTFYGAASPSGLLASGTAGTTAVATALTLGQTIGSTLPAGSFYNQFQTTGGQFQTTGQNYLGFRFLNEATGVQDYAWLLIQTTAGTGANLGFPASILGYAYENTGASINAGQTMTAAAVPEPSSFLLMGLPLVGLLAGRRVLRRRSAA